MNCKIPFTKDITFEKKVSEITSISLEHEIKTEDNLLKGNFIVSGDFKSHEVSVNKEPFSYILPFEIELADDVDQESIEFMIDDFTYEVVDNSILRVVIDFNVLANKKTIEEIKEEPIFRDASELFLENDDIIVEAVSPIDLVEEELREEVEEPKEPEIDRNVGIVETAAVVKEEQKETISEDTIINSIKNTNDEYSTYHIHVVSDGESVETICTMYNSNMNILADYNDLGELSEGDKIIIPEKNE